MKNLVIISFLVLFSCNTKNKPENIDAMTQNLTEIHAIKKMLKAQQECWNNGDIDGFMQGYWNSEDLVFTSLNHKPAYGWQNTLKRYKKRYPTRSAMGELVFEILDLQLISEKNANLKGNWKLIRKNDQPNGMFWCDLGKFDDNWVITKDSTISFEINKVH